MFIAFGLAFSLLPARSDAVQGAHSACHRRRQHRLSPWTPWLSRWFIRILRHRRAILGVTALLTLASIGLLSGIQVNNFLLEDLREDDPWRQEFNFFEHEFSGVRPYELALRFEPGREVMTEPGVLAAVDSVETWLAQDVGAGSVLGPASLARTAHRLINGDRPSANRIPEGAPPSADRSAAETRPQGRRWRDADGAARSGPTWALARITAKTADLGAKVLAGRNAAFLDRVEAHLEDHFESPPYSGGHRHGQPHRPEQPVSRLRHGARVCSSPLASSPSSWACCSEACG